MYTLIKRSVASLSGPGLLNEIPNFLFYKTLRGLGFPLMVKVFFLILSLNFSEIQHPYAGIPARLKEGRQVPLGWLAT